MYAPFTIIHMLIKFQIQRRIKKKFTVTYHFFKILN